jgi:hypothetical protein
MQYFFGKHTIDILPNVCSNKSFYVSGDFIDISFDPLCNNSKKKN